MHQRHISLIWKLARSIGNYFGFLIKAIAMASIFIIIMSFCGNIHIIKTGIPLSTFALTSWSAVVTGTTVGYGGRVPRSTLAKILDACWIVGYMIMCYALNATASSYVLNKTEIYLKNTTIGVLNNSYESEIAFNHYPHSIIVPYNTYEEIKNALVSGHISASLLNADYVSWISDNLKSVNIRTVKLPEYNSPVNALGEIANITSKFFSCMVNKDKLTELATEYFRRECSTDVHFDNVVSLYKQSWTFRIITAVETLLILSGFIFDVFLMKTKARKIYGVKNKMK